MFPSHDPVPSGVGIQANEIINENGGLVVFTSTDQAGNFRIGNGVVINQQDGSISGEAYTRSLFEHYPIYSRIRRRRLKDAISP